MVVAWVKTLLIPCLSWSISGASSLCSCRGKQGSSGLTHWQTPTIRSWLTAAAHLRRSCCSHSHSKYLTTTCSHSAGSPETQQKSQRSHHNRESDQYWSRTSQNPFTSCNKWPGRFSTGAAVVKHTKTCTSGICSWHSCAKSRQEVI